MMLVTFNKKVFFAFLLVVCIFNNSRGQKIIDLFNGYTNENATQYLAPMSSLLAGSLHTNIREWGKIDTSFYLKLGVNISASFPRKCMRSFDAKTGEGFEPEQTVEVPTIIGNNEVLRADGINGTAYYFPVGYDLKRLPFAVPQLTFGGIFNSEMTLRFFAVNTDGEIDKIQFFGIGLRHDLTQYFRKLPVDFSASYLFQKFDTRPHVFGTYHLIAAHVGNSGKWWTSLFTIGYQYVENRFEYTTNESEGIVSHIVNVNGKSPFFAEIMGGVKLWIFNVRGAVSYSGPYTTSLGINFSF